MHIPASEGMEDISGVVLCYCGLKVAYFLLKSFKKKLEDMFVNLYPFFQSEYLDFF